MTIDDLDGMSLENFAEYTMRGPGVVVVLFSTRGQQDTKQVERAFEKLSGFYRNQVQFARCDPDSAPELAEAYHVEHVPDVLVCWGPRVTERLYGVRTFEELQAIVAAGLERAIVLHGRAAEMMSR